MRKSFVFLYLCLAAVCLWGAEGGAFAPKANSPRRSVLNSKISLVLKPGSFEVVVPKKASPTAKYAGQLLSETLGKIMNCKVPVLVKGTGKIALHVGDLELAAQMKLDINALDRDGFYIRSAGKQLLIIGRDDRRAYPLSNAGYVERATLFGVQDFLERFAGVRYYFPGEMGTIIPRKKEIVLPGVDIAERPDMQHRTFYFKTWGPIMEGQRFEYSGAPKNWRQLSAFQLRTSTLYIPNCHGLGYLGLVERFGKTHPEYFALNKNGRRWNAEVKMGNSNYDLGHLCFSNMDLKNEIYQDAVALLTGKPASSRGVQNGHGRVAWGFPHRKPFFNLMPNDGMPPCYCEKCKEIFAGGDKKKIGNFMWNYFSSFAKKLQKDKIPGFVTCMAYAEYKAIPDCDIPSNVILQLALTGPYDERLPSQKDNDRLLRAWHKKLGTKPYLWLYPTKARAVVGWIPNSTPRAMGSFLKRQADHTFGAFLESETDVWLFGFLNHYVAAKVMWNASTDVDKLLDEHYKLMYGAAAPIVRKIFDRCEEIWLTKICGNVIETSVGPKGVVPSQTEIWNNIYNAKMIAEVNKEFDKAEKLVKKDPEALKRLKFIRAEFWGPVTTGLERYRRSCEIADEGVMNELAPGEKITVDGKLNDPAWKKAIPVWLRARKGDVTDVETKVYMLRDKDHFYFGFRCEEPFTSKIVAADRKHDDQLLWEDNCVEVYLDTRGDRKEYYQIMLSSKNCVTDLYVRPGDMRWKWNSKAVTAVSLQPGKSWCAEIKVPRSSMAPAGKKGINADFTRLRSLKAQNTYYNWIKLPPRNMVEQFGIVHFKAPENRNLLKDQDFQGKLGSAKRFIGPWAAHKVIYRDTQVFRFGGSSCRMETPGCHIVSQSLPPLKPNTKYQLSYFIKLEKLTHPGLYVRVFEGNGRVHTLPKVFPKGTAPWHKLTFTFKSGENLPPKGKKANVLFVLFKRTTGKVWIDRVELIELSKKNK